MGIPETRYRVGSLDYSVMALSEAIALVTELGMTTRARGLSVHFANAYNIALADSDPEFRRTVRAGDLVFSDGVPVVWAGRRLHPAQAAAWQRVYGPDATDSIEGFLGIRSFVVLRSDDLATQDMALKAAADALKAELDFIQGTRSWKVTAPLRKMKGRGAS